MTTHSEHREFTQVTYVATDGDPITVEAERVSDGWGRESPVLAEHLFI